MHELKQLKNSIRTECKNLRKEMSAVQRNNADRLIFEKTAEILEKYPSEYLYCYVSSPEIEVDTLRLIDTSLKKNITIIVPKCVKGSCTLEHYIIHSRNELEKGAFGIYEPDSGICRKADPPYSGVCIVPGLAFDTYGIRMGYGKGYYDRFLENFSGLKIGLCYECCLYEEQLPHDRFDAVMDIVVTERRQIKLMKNSM